MRSWHIRSNKPTGYKPFSQENYNKYEHCETMLLEKIVIPHHRLKRNPDRHGIDVLVIRNKDGRKVGGLEAESHAKYWAEQFPFNTVHFLGRKTKYI